MFFSRFAIKVYVYIFKKKIYFQLYNANESNGNIAFKYSPLKNNRENYLILFTI